jgi:hypothetical protein
MSKSKDLINDRNSQWMAALDVAVEAGVLQVCEHHTDGIFRGGRDVQNAYKLANARYTVGEMDMFSSRPEMTDAIKEVVSDHSMDKCSWCAQRQEDD